LPQHGDVAGAIRSST